VIGPSVATEGTVVLVLMLMALNFLVGSPGDQPARPPALLNEAETPCCVLGLVACAPKGSIDRQCRQHRIPPTDPGAGLIKLVCAAARCLRATRGWTGGMPDLLR
jgi:hypothetical protein